MKKTGYIIEEYIDINPYSESYNETKTERVLNEDECPVDKNANWVNIYSYCEMDIDGAFTGYMINIYEDVEPTSSTYQQQIEERVENETDCPKDEDAPKWEQTGPAYCEQIAYQPSGRMGNSGYLIIEYKDVNEYSPTYGTIRQERTLNPSGCPAPNTSPVYVISSEVCNQVEDPHGVMVNDGTKTVVRVDTNEYSSSYNFGEPETVVIEDNEMCPPTSTSPDWQETGYSCEKDGNYNTGRTIITEQDVNEHSATYGETRTRTVEDDERCPYQPKPQPVTVKWKVVNNRSSNTDTINEMTVSFNNGLVLSLNGTIAPAGGVLRMTSNMSGELADTPQKVSVITVSPNTAKPTQFQWSQSPDPYVWSDSDGSDVLTITLMDGDGTAPIWTEQSYSCVQSEGFNTGDSIVTEIDSNVESATYGQTRTRTIQDDERCPVDSAASWQELSYTCETINGFNTGKSLSVQKDINPNSPSYGTTRQRYIDDDERCPVSTVASWEEISYYCQKTQGFDNGNTVITEEDKNPGSRTYGETRSVVSTNDPRCVQDKEPSWQEISYVCEGTQSDTDPIWKETSITCVLDKNNKNTGYATVIETDINPNSPTYNQSRTMIYEDLENCPSSIRDYKLKYTTADGKGQIDCNDNPKLYKDIIPSGIVTGIIGDCVKSIENSTFSNCSSLASIDIPYNVQSIGNYAFSNCTSLASIDVSDNINYIGNNCFESCTSLSKVNIGNGISDISQYAFNGCTSLTNITFRNSVTSIGQYAFSNCSSLTSVDIPDSVTSIGEYAFRHSGLTRINIPDSVTSIGQYSFRECSSLTNTTIGNGVTSIGNSAFLLCQSLTSVTIGSGVTTIGRSAFYNCTSMASITIKATTPPTLVANSDGYSRNQFDKTNNCPILVPAASVEAYKAATGWVKYASRIQSITS